MNARTGRSVPEFRQALEDNLYYLRGSAMPSASAYDIYYALAHTVRDYLIDHWRQTSRTQFGQNPKFVYYLSAEYLLGRQLPQNLLYADLIALARTAVDQEERARLYREMQTIVQEDAPWVFVANWKQNAVTSDRVGSFGLEPSFLLHLQALLLHFNRPIPQPRQPRHRTQDHKR